MATEQVRLKLIELARPHGIAVPDMEIWLHQAKELEAYFDSVGQAVKPQHDPVATASQKPGQPASRGPAPQRR